jgi:hypothetical protein
LTKDTPKIDRKLTKDRPKTWKISTQGGDVNFINNVRKNERQADNFTSKMSFFFFLFFFFFFFFCRVKNQTKTSKKAQFRHIFAVFGLKTRPRCAFCAENAQKTAPGGFDFAPFRRFDLRDELVHRRLLKRPGDVPASTHSPKVSFSGILSVKIDPGSVFRTKNPQKTTRFRVKTPEKRIQRGCEPPKKEKKKRKKKEKKCESQTPKSADPRSAAKVSKRDPAAEFQSNRDPREWLWQWQWQLHWQWLWHWQWQWQWLWQRGRCPSLLGKVRGSGKGARGRPGATAGDPRHWQWQWHWQWHQWQWHQWLWQWQWVAGLSVATSHRRQQQRRLRIHCHRGRHCHCH